MSGQDYARATGAEAPAIPAQAPPERARKPLPPLSEREQAQIAERRALHHQYMPEFLPFVREMHELGLIDGWRSVRKIEVFKKNTETAP